MVKVLVVDDLPECANLLGRMLGDQGYEILLATGGHAALEIAVRERPDVILMDVRMPELDGIEVCRRLKADPDLRTIPVILVTVNSREEDIVKGLDAGADDYVTKPFSRHVLAARTRAALRTKRLEDILLKQAHIDPLTGLPNRRTLMERLGQEWERAQRYGRPLSLIMADVDHFKNVNDIYGHLAGDRVLQNIAQTIAQQCRQADLAARYGGEEFAIVVPDQAADASLHLAERCRQQIEDLRFATLTPRFEVTASLGVADSDGLASPEALIRLADAALYDAKRAGRNTVRAVLREPVP